VRIVPEWPEGRLPADPADPATRLALEDECKRLVDEITRRRSRDVAGRGATEALVNLVEIDILDAQEGRLERQLRSYPADPRG
jgi:hypothetical protein